MCMAAAASGRWGGRASYGPNERILPAAGHGKRSQVSCVRSPRSSIAMMRRSMRRDVLINKGTRRTERAKIVFLLTAVGR